MPDPISWPVTWQGALNARHALPSLIRSADLSFLTAHGRAELLAAGISRIIDLRTRAERHTDPAPFAGRPEYLNLPLLPSRDRALNQASADARSNADHYRAHLDRAGNQLAAIFGAMHDAPPGPLLIHCHAGKDRTGLVAAMAHDLCGQPREQIAAGGLIEAGEQAQQSALAASAAPDHGDELPRRNVQVDVTQHLPRAEGLLQIAHYQRNPAQQAWRLLSRHAAPPFAA